MKILIYSSNLCPYCFAAKKLLKEINLNFKEILVDNDPQIKDEMIALSDGKTTVPQIFFGEKHIGGYDDLKKFYDEGKLSLLLKDEN